VAVVVGGLITGLKVPFIAPILLFLSNRRDLLLIGMCAYFLALGFEMPELDFFGAFSVLVPSFLLFVEGLKGKLLVSSLARTHITTYALVLLVVSGLVVKQLFIVGVLSSIVYRMLEDRPSKGIVVIICFMCALFLALKISAIPVVVAGAGAMCALVFWSDVKQLGMIKL